MVGEVLLSSRLVLDCFLAQEWPGIALAAWYLGSFGFGWACPSPVKGKGEGILAYLKDLRKKSKAKGERKSRALSEQRHGYCINSSLADVLGTAW